MKGLTENKWNKSLVIFLSFIFDTSFVYLNKDVQFNKETNYKCSRYKTNKHIRNNQSKKTYRQSSIIKNIQIIKLINNQG